MFNRQKPQLFVNKDKAEQERKRLVQAYHVLFKSPEAATVLADLRERFMPVYPLPPSVTHDERVFQAGQQAVIAFLHDTLQLNPYQLESEAPSIDQGDHHVY